MYLFLSREGSRAEIQIRLPGGPDTIWHEIDRLDEQGKNYGPVRIVGTDCPAGSLVQYIKCADLDSEADIQKLDQLAKQVDGMSAQEQQVFSGALDAESINGLDDVLRVASSLSQYELIEGVTTNKELGGWLVENGMAGVDIPAQVRPYLDYAGIGVEYYSSHGGAYTPQGYVKRRETAQVQAVDDTLTFALTLITAAGCCSLSFPASDSDLERAKQILRVGDLDRTSIIDIEIGYPWAHLLPMERITVDNANALAQCVNSMTKTEFTTFGAVLEAEEPDTFSKVVCAAMDIDDYELVDDNEGAYGREALRKAGASSEVFDLLDGYTDFERLGRAMMEEDGVRPTSFGLVKRLSLPFDQQPEMGPTMC